MIAATDPGGYAACCEAIASMDLRAGLPIGDDADAGLSGAQDPAILAVHGRAIADAIPGARATSCSTRRRIWPPSSAPTPSTS